MQLRRAASSETCTGLQFNWPLPPKTYAPFRKRICLLFNRAEPEIGKPIPSR